MSIKNLLLHVAVALQVNKDRLLGVGAVVAVSGFILAPDVAMAEGIGGWARNAKMNVRDIIDFGLYGSYGAGLAATGIGISNAIKKSKGDNQVTTGSIFGYGLGGPAWMMLTYFATTMAETMGGSGATVYMPSGY